MALSQVGGDSGHSNRWSGGAVGVTNTGSGPAACTLNDAPKSPIRSAEGTYTGGLWVGGGAPWTGAGSIGKTLKLRLREWSAGTVVGSATAEVTLTEEDDWHGWQHLTVSYRPKAPGTSTLDLNAYVLGAPPRLCFHADEASLVLVP